MSSILLRCRLVSRVLKRNRRLFSSDVASTPPKEPLIGAQSLVSDLTPPPPPPPPPPSTEASNASSGKAWNFLKYSLIGAITGATATVGYASYGMSCADLEMMVHFLCGFFFGIRKRALMWALGEKNKKSLVLGVLD